MPVIAVLVLRVILTGIEHSFSDKFAVVHRLSAGFVPCFVVPVHNHRFVLGVDLVIMDILNALHRLSLVLDLWVSLFQYGIVNHRGIKEICAVLNVRYTGLPEQIEHRRTANGDIPQTVFGFIVPCHTIRRRARLALVPHGVGIDAFEVVVLGDDRQDFG